MIILSWTQLLAATLLEDSTYIISRVGHTETIGAISQDSNNYPGQYIFEAAKGAKLCSADIVSIGQLMIDIKEKNLRKSLGDNYIETTL